MSSYSAIYHWLSLLKSLIKFVVPVTQMYVVCEWHLFFMLQIVHVLWALKPSDGEGDAIAAIQDHSCFLMFLIFPGQCCGRFIKPRVVGYYALAIVFWYG